MEILIALLVVALASALVEAAFGQGSGEHAEPLLSSTDIFIFERSMRNG